MTSRQLRGSTHQSRWNKISTPPHQHGYYEPWSRPEHTHDVIYHVAPAKHRDNISQYGLVHDVFGSNYSFGKSYGIYGWSTPYAAKKYADVVLHDSTRFNPRDNDSSLDIWKIKVQDKEEGHEVPSGGPPLLDDKYYKSGIPIDDFVKTDDRVHPLFGHAHYLYMARIHPDYISLHSTMPYNEDRARQYDRYNNSVNRANQTRHQYFSIPPFEGAWKDVRQKAKTINAEGAVEIIRLDDDVILSKVIGDHGTYDVEIYRQYPGERGVTFWSCSCKWGDWAFNRVLYNGRMCSHALATLYAAHGHEYRKAMRNDTDMELEEHNKRKANTIRRLFIDDVRQPPDETWEVVRTGQEALDKILTNQYDEISFDHDLGESSEFDGSEITKRMVNHMIENDDWEPPEIMKIHSANPIGSERMQGYINDMAKIKGMRKQTSAYHSTAIACIYTGDGEVDVYVEIADNPDAIRLGLMHRGYMPWDSGMVFLFPHLVADGFWMKDTLIPLSIAFWDASGRIIDIKDMEPQNRQIIRPKELYKGALEVNQGFFEFHNIKIGDRITVIE